LSRTFQITAVIPSFSALANVALAAQATAGSSFRFLRPVATEDALNARAHACLESVGLASRATAPASDLSHGARRLLELAMALATTPKLLLLDEPMAGLGRAESRDVIDVLATLRRDVAMLLVEHDMDAVFALADEVSVLVSGSIVTTGTPAAVRADRQARAAYLGDDTMAADVHGEIAP
ncbi:MAG: ATP-binding cassette domain-containing protein, partial [Pseudomonadota bacterium]